MQVRLHHRPDGGILNDPVLLWSPRTSSGSLADSDVNLYALGIAAAKGMDVTVQEIDAAPVQIQGPNAKKVLADLFGERVLEIPYYGLMQASSTAWTSWSRAPATRARSGTRSTCATRPSTACAVEPRLEAASPTGSR